jgi:hypothetical protein
MMQNLRTKRMLTILGYRSTEAEEKRLSHNVQILAPAGLIDEFKQELAG